MVILLVGHGKMAEAVKVECDSQGIRCIHVQDTVGYDYPFTPVVAIHLGSGRQILELINYCEQFRIPIIQGSTKLLEPLPMNRDVLIVNAPNLSLPMVRFMAAFPAFADMISAGMEVGIIESHQSKKADTSGTARAIAKELGIPETAIISVRDKNVQRSLGVPEGYLGGHAYHDFIFAGEGVEIKVSTRIHGRETYAKGALNIARALLTMPSPLHSGVYELKDILPLLRLL